MSSTQDVVRGAAGLKTPTKKYKKSHRTGRPGKKRLEIFLDNSKKAFDGWEGITRKWNHEDCEEYIEWCHIGKGFPHARYYTQRRADKANLHYCKWPVFKERCIEMYQHIYETPDLDRNECPLSILRMVYAEVVLGKEVDWMTLKIQPKSNMKAPMESFYPRGRKYPGRGLSKKKSNKAETPDEMVEYSSTSSDDAKSGCIKPARKAFYATIKGRNLVEDLNEMLDNDLIQEPLPLQAIEGEVEGRWEEGEGSGPTMDEGIPTMEIPTYNPYEEVGKLKALLEEKDLEIRKKDLKIQQLEDELMSQKNMVSQLSGNAI
jgi:hypothetical protein